MNQNKRIPEHEYRLPRNPFILMVPALAGGTAGFLLITLGIERDLIGERFAALPEIHLWRLLITAQMAYFAGILPAIIVRVRHVLKDGFARSELFVTSASMVAALLAFFAPLAMGPSGAWGITVLDQRLPFVPISAGVVMLAAYFGLMLLYLSFRRLRDAGDIGIDTLRDYLAKKREARWFLSVLGTMIAVGTLATGALRQALEALDASGTGVQPPPLTSGMVLAYGAYFTVLLAIVYAPVHIAEQAVGKRIYLVTLKEQLTADSTIDEFVKLRDQIHGLLELGSNMRENLQSSLAILSPVLAALFSTLLEAG